MTNLESTSVGKSGQEVDDGDVHLRSEASHGSGHTAVTESKNQNDKSQYIRRGTKADGLSVKM